MGTVWSAMLENTSDADRSGDCFPAEYPFLQGRAFVFASQFVLVLEEAKMSGQYLEAAIQALEAETEVPVKLSAIKTIRK